jgi:hypothetical protein
MRLPNLPARRPPLTALFALALALPAGRVEAQDDDGYRIGLTVGGTSTIAVVLERMEGRRGLELTMGTWSFRNVSFSAVVKGYLGPSAFRPAIGAGLWALASFSAADGERRGMALLARFPIGFDWRVASGNYVGLEVGVTRALWIRRADFSELSPSPRLVPIPGFSYRVAP